jgi:putative endonuclease
MSIFITKNAFSKLKLPNINIYYVYIVTDKDKTTLETGVAGALNVRLNKLEHHADNNTADGAKPYCMYLVYWEEFTNADEAIAREKKIKKMSKSKKEELVERTNLKWRFLNEDFNVV